MSKAITIVLVILLAFFVYGCHFKIWRLQHPEAPTWTYFLR